jgi:hypothetical protein
VVALVISLFAGDVRHLMTKEITVHMENDLPRPHNKETMAEADMESQSHQIVRDENTIDVAHYPTTLQEDQESDERTGMRRKPKIEK